MNWNEVLLSLGETLLIVAISTFAAYLVGLPLGIILHLTSKRGLKPNRIINSLLGFIVNTLRSIPCLILVVLSLPFVRLVFGRGTGEWYTMLIPLFLASFAYVSRVVEQSLGEVDPGKIEAAKSLGASSIQIIAMVYLPEARTSLLTGLAVTAVNILGYTSFAYNIGAGGLIAYIWSYYTHNTRDFASSWEFWVMILIVVLLVELIQELGLYLVKKTDKRKAIS
ncbi:MAG: ABC transporter permease [Bacilli bacterium]|nr:ABC transporter permease [Bacilli bacterium]